MRGTIPPLPQYAFMAWYLVKAQGQLYLTRQVLIRLDLITLIRFGEEQKL
jgi:hypothetical protein